MKIGILPLLLSVTHVIKWLINRCDVEMKNYIEFATALGDVASLRASASPCKAISLSL